MVEVQIRCLNQKQADKITDILFKYVYGALETKAYKNEFREDVSEFVFYRFKRKSKDSEEKSE